MSQHDYDIADGSGASVRSDLNSVFNAIVTNNSGASEPTATFAYMWWFDTNNSLLKQRNGANTSWVVVASLVGTTWTPYFEGSPMGDASTYDVGSSTGQVPTAEIAALLARAGAFTRQQYFTPLDLDETTGGDVDWPLETGQVAYMDLTASITMAAPSGQHAGGFYTLVLTQAGAGSYTVTWNAAFNFGSAGAPTLSTTVGKTDVLTFFSFGSEMLFLGIVKGF